MTGTIGSTATTTVLGLLNATNGVNGTLEALALPNPPSVALVSTDQIRSQNVAADIAERSQLVQYPAMQVYCEKIVNSLEEKFRTFSGTLQMAIEVRYSQDRLDGLESAVETYTDAVMQVLDANRGDWGNGLYYAGGYQAAFGAVKHGGKNFAQMAKVTFEIGASIS